MSRETPIPQSNTDTIPIFGQVTPERDNEKTLEIDDTMEVNPEQTTEKSPQPRMMMVFEHDGIWSSDFEADGYIPENIIARMIYKNIEPGPDDEIYTHIAGIPAEIPKEISFRSIIKKKEKDPKSKKDVTEQNTRYNTFRLDKLLGMGGMGAVIGAQTRMTGGERKTYQEDKLVDSETIDDNRPDMNIAVKLSYVPLDDDNYYYKMKRTIREAALYTTLNPDQVTQPDIAQSMQARYQDGRPVEPIEGLPKCVGVTQVDYDHGTLYAIAFENVEGHALSQHDTKYSFEDDAETSNNLSPTDTMKIMLPISVTISELHNRGIIHRDVKPGNMIGDPENPDGTKLIDLGIGKDKYSEMIDEMGEQMASTSVNAFRGEAVNRLTDNDSALGTPRYMDRAAAEGRADDLSDVYAFCVSAADITGAVKFNGDNIVDVMRNIHYGTFVEFIDVGSGQFQTTAERDFVRLCKDGTKPRFPEQMQDIRRQVVLGGLRKRVGPAPVESHKREYTQKEFDILADLGKASVEVRDGFYDKQGEWHDPVETYKIDSGDIPGSVKIKEKIVNGKKTTNYEPKVYEHVVLVEKPAARLRLSLAELVKLNNFAGKHDGDKSYIDLKAVELINKKLETEKKRVYDFSAEEQATLIAFFHQERLQKYMSVDIEQQGMAAVNKRLSKIIEARNKELGIVASENQVEQIARAEQIRTEIDAERFEMEEPKGEVESLGEIEVFGEEHEKEVEEALEEAEKAAG